MLYYDMDGNPISLMQWANMLENMLDRDRRIGFDQIGISEVSTVWLGLNHNWSGYGPPLIFETMVFGGINDLYCQRYSTKEAARAGHDQILAAVRDNRNIKDEKESNA